MSSRIDANVKQAEQLSKLQKSHDPASTAAGSKATDSKPAAKRPAGDRFGAAPTANKFALDAEARARAVTTKVGHVEPAHQNKITIADLQQDEQRRKA